MHTNAHAHTWHRPHAEALILRPTIYAQICIHIHIHMCINAYIYLYIHTCIYIHIYMSAHIHTYTYIHTHTKCTYVRTQARLERRCGSDHARSWCRRKKPCTFFAFDAIKPHLAPPMLGLHCTHFLRHQYPSTPHALFPTYLRTVRAPRASVILLFHTDPMNRVHSSEEAPRSFTMAPCVVVERLEGKQRCSRAPVDEHADVLAREWPKWLFTEKRKVNKEQPNPATAYHAITTARRPDNNRSSALVRSLSTQFMARPSCELTSRCSEIGFTFSTCSRRLNMCTLYTYTNINMSRFSLSGFFRPSRCLIPTPGLTSEYPICAVCVCVCAYTHTYTHIHSHPR